MKLLADLHNHSCLSPCASLELSPTLLAAEAKAKGIGLLALTDHNATLNCPAFGEACARQGILPLFGVEACSQEEVHILFLFGTVGEATGFGEYLRALVPELRYDPAKLGDQVVVDVDENILDMPEYYLGSALDAGFEELCAEGESRGALVIPAHVDRPMFSVSSQLGFLPPGPYAAVESMREPSASLRLGHTAISGSDAHWPEHVGRRPFLVDIDLSGCDTIGTQKDTDGTGGAGSADGAIAGGSALVDALRTALAAGRVLPSWRIGGPIRAQSGHRPSGR